MREALGATPDAWQDAALHALIDDPRHKLALKACKGPGKTCFLAWAILWFLTCFEDAKVVCTSITGENLRDGLWTELSIWIKKSSLLDSLFEWQTERVYMRERMSSWYASARTWPKDADKTKQANTLAGIHAKHSMVVLDESGDIPRGVLSAGLAHHSTQDPTGEDEEIHYTLQCGNPTCLDGSLGWACTEDATNWWIYEITGDPDDPMRAPRIDPDWAREQIEAWGADNPWVLVNVFGKFPPTQSNKLLGPEQVRAAQKVIFHESLWHPHPRVMAVDVARSETADRSVLCRRQGPVVFPFLVYRTADLMELSGQVAFEFSRWPAQVVFVDMAGLGSGVYDRLRELGLPVIQVWGSGVPRDPRFADKRAEMWWLMAQEVKGSGGQPMLSLPNIVELVQELTGPEVGFNNRAKVRLESKESMKRRGLPSPDIGDALAMTYAEPVAITTDFAPSTVAALRRRSSAEEYDPFRELR